MMHSLSVRADNGLSARLAQSLKGLPPLAPAALAAMLQRCETASYLGVIPTQLSRIRKQLGLIKQRST